jgi:hypothetical protein
MLTRRETLIFHLTLAVIILALCLNFLILPALKKNAALNKEISLAQAKLKNYTLLLAQKEKIKNKYDKLGAGLDLSKKNQDSLMSVLSELETYAREGGLRIIDLRPQASPNSKVMVVDLKTEGPLEGYIKFIFRIENSLLLLNVEKLRLTAQSDSANLEGNFSILKPSLD